MNKCPGCGGPTFVDESNPRYRWCPACRRHAWMAVNGFTVNVWMEQSHEEQLHWLDRVGVGRLRVGMAGLVLARSSGEALPPGLEEHVNNRVQR